MARGGPAVSPLLCWWQPSLLILRKPRSCRDNRDKGRKIFPSNFQEDRVLAGGWGAQGSAQGACRGTEEDGEEEEEGRRPCAGARGCLALGRVSLAAASSGRSPYLSEDFVTMATLMSSALRQRAALTSSATFFFSFFSFLFPFWGFLFI